MDDFIVKVWDATEVEPVDTTIQETESVAESETKAEKSVDLRLGPWTGRMRYPNGVIGLWTDGAVKLLRAWFGFELQVEEVVIGMTIIH